MSLLLAIWFSVAVPKGVILVKGATPSASDASTPLPEQGSVAAGRYRNPYFGLAYPIPAGWSEQPAGPPPSDGGNYVLASFGAGKANVLLTAQDLFFGPRPAAAARLAPPFQLESAPAEVTIGGRTFQRVAYGAPVAGLHWRMLSTEARCHVLTFTFSGTDVAALDAAERAMSAISLAPAGPACIADYADAVERTPPAFITRRHNPIPVRVILGKDGRVKHAHLLSAFPDQSDAILAALRAWRFKPYQVDERAVEVETGLMFGAAVSSSSR
jgi:hypothetical protein